MVGDDDKHPEKQESLRDVIDSGNMIDDNFKHPEKQ
jgi:hypothetical protein